MGRSLTAQPRREAGGHGSVGEASGVQCAPTPPPPPRSASLSHLSLLHFRGGFLRTIRPPTFRSNTPLPLRPCSLARARAPRGPPNGCPSPVQSTADPFPRTPLSCLPLLYVGPPMYCWAEACLIAREGQGCVPCASGPHSAQRASVAMGPSKGGDWALLVLGTQRSCCTGVRQGH